MKYINDARCSTFKHSMTRFLYYGDIYN